MERDENNFVSIEATDNRTTRSVQTVSCTFFVCFAVNMNFWALTCLVLSASHPCRLLPQVGMVTIMMNDYPQLKFALIGLLGLLVMTNKES